MGKIFWPAWAVAAALCVSPGAFANDVDVSVLSKVSVGQSGRVTVKVNKGVESMVLSVQASGYGKVVKKASRTGVGETVEFVLPVQKKPGQVRWRGNLKVTFGDESFGQMPLSFSTEAVAAMRVMPVEGKTDMGRHTMTVVMDRICDKLEVAVYDIDGGVIAQREVACAGTPPGKEIAVTWVPKNKKRVFRISLKGTDPDTIFGTTETYPYRVEVAHEEVQFDSGKAEVKPDQAAKLAAVLPKMKDEAGRAQKGLKFAKSKKRVRLFIIGHTDTVGAAATNRALSDRRAGAIAGWFAKKKLGVHIYARGYGESMLKVATPDETDEQQNRRVDYVLAIDSPTGSLAGWRKVQ